MRALQGKVVNSQLESSQIRLTYLRFSDLPRFALGLKGASCQEHQYPKRRP